MGSSYGDTEREKTRRAKARYLEALESINNYLNDQEAIDAAKKSKQGNTVFHEAMVNAGRDILKSIEAEVEKNKSYDMYSYYSLFADILYCVEEGIRNPTNWSNAYEFHRLTRQIDNEGAGKAVLHASMNLFGILLIAATTALLITAVASTFFPPTIVVFAAFALPLAAASVLIGIPLLSAFTCFSIKDYKSIMNSNPCPSANAQARMFHHGLETQQKKAKTDSDSPRKHQ